MQCLTGLKQGFDMFLSTPLEYIREVETVTAPQAAGMGLQPD